MTGDEFEVVDTIDSEEADVEDPHYRLVEEFAPVLNDTSSLRLVFDYRENVYHIMEEKQ